MIARLYPSYGATRSFSRFDTPASIEEIAGEGQRSERNLNLIVAAWTAPGQLRDVSSPPCALTGAGTLGSIFEG